MKSLVNLTTAVAKYYHIDPLGYTYTFSTNTEKEPYVVATIVSPSEYLGGLMDLCQKKRGKQVDMKYVNMKIAILKYEIPLAEIIVGFYDALKSVSKGYASFDYEHIAPQLGELVKL